MTPQRRAIIQVLLEKAGLHPTAEQVLAGAHGLMSDMSPAAVYNTLHELVEMGMLLELALGPRDAGDSPSVHQWISGNRPQSHCARLLPCLRSP